MRTDQPFEQIGAPWIDGPRLAASLNARGLGGIRFYPVRFTPASSVHEGQLGQGVFMVITNCDVLQPTRVGLEIALALYALHGASFDAKTSERLVGTPTALARARAGDYLVLPRRGPGPRRRGGVCGRSICCISSHLTCNGVCHHHDL